MRIIEHRGGWCDEFSELNMKKSIQNTSAAFRKSLLRFNGIETDLYSHCGTVVISHDPPKESAQTFRAFIEKYHFSKSKVMLALNIKCDGIKDEVHSILSEYKIENYFVFDMSIPQTIQYLKSDVNYYLRVSDYELYPEVFLPEIYRKATGIWFDQFEDDLNEKKIKEDIIKYINDNKAICVVSPELHSWGRKDNRYKDYWELYLSVIIELKSSNVNIKNIFLCTDLPTEAKFFFNKK